MKLKKLFLIVSLCVFIDLNAEVTNISMPEQGIDNWYIYDKWPSGAKKEKINDSQRGSVIKFTGTISNGIRLMWEDYNNVLQWKMKSDKWNAFYIVIQTSKGFRYLTYSPNSPGNKNEGIGKKQKYKIRIGLGSKMMDGKWHTFTRNIEADLKKFEPDNNYLYIKGIKFRGTGSFDDIKTMLNVDTTKKKEIFIIGPSTVNIGKEWNAHAKEFGTLTCGDTNPDNILKGWAEEFYKYSKVKVNNFARLGSNAITFRTGKYGIAPYQTYYGKNDWKSTYKAMQKASKGSFLLIQFGGNAKFDSRLQSRKGFYNAISEYIDSAKALEMIPVLVTSLDGHTLDDREGRKRWVKYMRDLAKERGILLLDLMKKSNTFFDKLNQKELNKFGECIQTSIYNTKKILHSVHLSPNGAKIVAGWVKELACDTRNTHSDKDKLCSVLK